MKAVLLAAVACFGGDDKQVVPKQSEKASPQPVTKSEATPTASPDAGPSDKVDADTKDGGSLIAEVTPAGDAQFNFKLLGAPDDDTGLEFRK